MPTFDNQTLDEEKYQLAHDTVLQALMIDILIIPLHSSFNAQSFDV